METLLDGLKAIKLWQIGVLVAVLLGAGGSTYGVYAFLSSSSGASLSEDQQLYTVQYGDLVNQVSTNGSLIFPNREALTIGTQGTIGDILVVEGQVVEEGQVLAKLDQSAVASLEKAVAQSRVSLQDADDALAKAKDPHTPVDISQAEANVANARLSLKVAQDSLDTLLNPTDQEIAGAEAAVANAQLFVEDAGNALADLLEISPRAIAQAELSVTNAKISVEKAREALELVTDGPSQEDIAQSQSQIDTARTALDIAKGDLSLAIKEWDGKVETSQDGFDTALGGYQTVFLSWLGIDPAEVDGDMDPDALLDSWGADLAILFDPSTEFEDVSRGFLAQGPPPNDPATPWHEIIVYAWMNLTPEKVVPICEGIAITDGIRCVKNEMDDGWSTLKAAADALDTVETQATKAVSNAEGAVIRAEESLATAEDSLADLRAGPDALETEGKEKELALAQANLLQAEEDLVGVMKEPEPLEVEAKRKQVAVAQANFLEAQKDLLELNNGPDPVELEVKSKQIDVARSTLDKATEDLAELGGSVDPLEVALRDADVASAQLALDTALERLEGATLRSPMAGVVSLVNVEAGQSVNPNTVIVEVVDPTVVEVDGIVDEIDVLFVRVGAQSAVIMDALPGGVLDGVVTTIGSAAQNQQGVVSYPISIRVQVPDGVQLREGLSATASIVIREDNDVLLVPNQSIYGTFEQPLVRLMRNGRLEARIVALGNSDDFWTVVEEGLLEGDQVVIETVDATTDPFASFRQQFEAGGFGRGGGDIRGGGGGIGGGGGFGGGGQRQR